LPAGYISLLIVKSQAFDGAGAVQAPIIRRLRDFRSDYEAKTILM
jgi:hypothetical protein